MSIVAYCNGNKHNFCVYLSGLSDFLNIRRIGEEVSTRCDSGVPYLHSQILLLLNGTVEPR